MSVDPKTADVFLATAAGPGGGPCWDYIFGCIDVSHAFPGTSNFPAGLAPNVRQGLYVEDNRDILTAQFLASGCAHMLMVDTDIGFRAGHVQMLLDAQKDVVTGYYVYKDDSNPSFVGQLRAETEGTLVRCNVVPGGFLLVTRKAVLQLCAHRAEQVYTVPEVGVVTALWQSTFKPGQPCTRDDGAFSKYCLEAGIPMWLHTECKLIHYGQKGFV